MTVICVALPPVDDDSAKTVDDWFRSDEHKKYFKISSSIILKYCPDNVIYPIKEYKIK